MSLSWSYSVVRTSPEPDTVCINSDADTAESALSRCLAQRPAERRLTLCRVALHAGALGLGLAVLVATCVQAGSGQATRSAHGASRWDLATNLESVSAVGSVVKALGELSEGIQGAAAMLEQVEHSYEDVNKMFKSLNLSVHIHRFGKLGAELVNELGKPIRLSEELKKKLRGFNATQKEKLSSMLLKQLNITSVHDLRPSNFGSTCEEDEEEYNGLCYKKCSLLTDNAKPVRITAFECCSHQPPCLGSAEIEAKICGGYGVSGDSTGNSCPHTPGGCLKDEELYEDMCYMRCSLVTFGVLRHRDGADTCCRSGSPLAMLVPGGCNTDARYSTGGGNADNDPSTPSMPHPPLRAS